MRHVVTSLGAIAFVASVLGSEAGCSAIVGIGDLPSPPGSDGGTSGSTGSTGTGPTGSCTVTPGGTCGLDPQCGCGAREKCDVLLTATSSTPECFSAGATPVGTVCGAPQDCAAGDTCLRGACRPLCEVADAQCSGTAPVRLGTCEQIDNTSTQVAVPGYKACLLPCAPWPSSCGVGLGCYVGTTNGVSISDCELAGTGLSGAACSNSFACAAGYVCVNATATCEQWCRVGGNDCPSGRSCVDGSVRLDGVEYGYCG